MSVTQKLSEQSMISVPYVQGKRRHCTPMELLTGQKQEKDWLDLLLVKVGKAAWS
jgi:hypothetical protein